MRELVPIPVLAVLLAVPTALSAPRSPAPKGDPILSASRSPDRTLSPLRSFAPKGHRPPSARRSPAPKGGRAPSAHRSPAPEGDRTVITSPLASDPLDAAEARGRLRVAKRSAERAAVAKRPASGSAAPASAAPATAVPAGLQAIAACESGGNPQAVSPGGDYRGKYQFSPSTWASVGGSGDPAAAPETEQDQRAAMLYARSGAGQWPVCGS